MPTRMTATELVDYVVERTIGALDDSQPYIAPRERVRYAKASVRTDLKTAAVSTVPVDGPPIFVQSASGATLRWYPGTLTVVAVAGPTGRELGLAFTFGIPPTSIRDAYETIVRHLRIIDGELCDSCYDAEPTATTVDGDELCDECYNTAVEDARVGDPDRVHDDPISYGGEL